MPELTANYLTIDPVTGAVGAVFPGGVQLPTQIPPLVSTTPPADKSVTWKSTVDGQITGLIYSEETAGASGSRDINVQGHGGDKARDVSAHLLAVNDNDADGTNALSGLWVYARATDTAVFGEVTALIQGSPLFPWQSKLIINQDGESDFIQLPGATPQRLAQLSGQVSAAGAVTRAYPPNSFTVTKGAAGAYTVNFAISFSDIPVVLITPIAGAPFFVRTGSPTASNVVIVTNNAAGTPADIAFNLLVTGPL